MSHQRRAQGARELIGPITDIFTARGRLYTDRFARRPNRCISFPEFAGFTLLGLSPSGSIGPFLPVMSAYLLPADHSDKVIRCHEESHVLRPFSRLVRAQPIAPFKRDRRYVVWIALSRSRFT